MAGGIELAGVGVELIPGGGGGAVTSVFGRTGAVVAANNDYTIAQIAGLGTAVATALGNTAGSAGGFALVGTTPPTGNAGGDLTGTYPNPTLSAVLTAGGPTGSATVAPIITYDAKGRLTAVSSATITPAVGSITGLGAGVATALGNTAGGAGGFALVGTTPPTGTAGGELSGTYPNPTLLNSAVIGKVLTGYVSGAGTVAATDSILQAIQKLNGNAIVGPVGTAGGSLKGTYPNPSLSDVNAIATSLAIGGATIGTDTLGVTGTAAISGATSLGNVNVTVTTVPVTGIYRPNTGLLGLSAGTSLRAQIGTSAASVSDMLFPGTMFTGGTATTTFPQMLFQPTGTAARTDYATTGTMIGANLVSGSTADFLNFGVGGGASVFKVSSTGSITTTATFFGANISGANIIASSISSISWNTGGILTSSAVGSITLGAANAASPVAQTLRAQSVVAGTSNTASPNLTLIAPLSTGSGLSGDLILQTGGTGAGTTAQNTATTALTLKGATQQANFAGAVLNRVLVSPKATTPITVASTDSNTYFTNEGASAQIIFNLPTAVANLTYTYFVEDSDGIQVVASSGDTLRIAGSVSATAGNIASTTIGSSVTLVAINATEWVAVAVVGTWVVT